MRGLDGLRGLAALYVVLFHCWLYTFPGYPDSSAPAWLDVLMFGRLAVVFFLVLSGFSLAISPAGHGWRSEGIASFLRRRAWRILPPYWAALAMSLAISWFVVPASHYGPPTGASILVYGLVAQDMFTAPTPNGAFWSIGVETELYLLFPLLLFVRRRFSAAVLVACVTFPVIAHGLMAAGASPVEGANRLTPHLAPVFVAGMLGAGIVAASDRVQRLPWGWFAVLAALPVVALGVIQGSVWTVNHYFWIDLALAPAMTMLLCRGCHRQARHPRTAPDRATRPESRWFLLQSLSDPSADRHGRDPPGSPAFRLARPAHVLVHAHPGPAGLGAWRMAVLPDLRDALQAEQILENHDLRTAERLPVVRALLLHRPQVQLRCFRSGGS
ncbi:acyltransferase [Streptomyces nodosus]|uniref:acyltransferase family protein n=1 Tax=Streptomyces nodosus TaxID=40318 RepID=UPI0034534D03